MMTAAGWLRGRVVQGDKDIHWTRGADRDHHLVALSGAVNWHFQRRSA